MLFGPTSSDPSVSGLPRGEVLGSFPTYLEARKVVDELAGQEFDVRTVSIVGTDLRTVERIRNRLTYPSVALRSALQGAFFGMMLGILMTLIDPAGSGIQILYTVGLGVAVWVLFGVIGHAMRKGRGVNSVQQLVPSNFDVVCEFETAAQAKQALGRPGTAPVPAPAAPVAPTPPPAPAPEQPQGPTSASSPAGSALAAPVPEPAAASAPAQPERTGTFPDLPDGRPQYGVRLPEDEAKEVQERILREHAAKNAPAGARGSGDAGAGSYGTPSYGKGGTGKGGTGKGGTGSLAGSGRRTDPNRPVDGGTAPAADGARPASGIGERDETVPETAAETGTGPGTGEYSRPRYGRRAAAGPEDPTNPRESTDPRQTGGKSGAEAGSQSAGGEAGAEPGGEPGDRP